jgi:hypothetical protein
VTSLSTEDPESSREGELLAEKYQLLCKLGEGGMGVVYEARHVLVGRHFAVKLLHRALAQNREAVLRFQREAQAAGALDCENVVAITDFGFSAEGAPYMVMDLLKGETSRALIAREGPLPVPRAVSLVLQACYAIDAAHARGIIHRDLKPDNLFVSRRSDGTDSVKVLDFGIAKLRSESQALISTQAGQVIGTLCYMPPEQVRGDKTIDHRADLYALGAILYECLTGQVPHPGTEAHHVIYHVLQEAPVDVDTIRPGLPAGLAGVVHRALAREPDDRYQSAVELMTALAPYANAGLSTVLAVSAQVETRLAAPRDATISVDPGAGVLAAATHSTERALVSTKSTGPSKRAPAVVVAFALVAVAVLLLWALWHSAPVSPAATAPLREPPASSATTPRSAATPKVAPSAPVPPPPEVLPAPIAQGVSAERPSVRPDTPAQEQGVDAGAPAVRTKASVRHAPRAPGKLAPQPALTPGENAARTSSQRITFERDNPYK